MMTTSELVLCLADRATVNGEIYSLEMQTHDEQDWGKPNILDSWGKPNGMIVVDLVRDRHVLPGSYWGMMMRLPHQVYCQVFDADEIGGERALHNYDALEEALSPSQICIYNAVDPVDEPAESGYVVRLALYPLGSHRSIVQDAHKRVMKLPWVDIGRESFAMIMIHIRKEIPGGIQIPIH